MLMNNDHHHPRRPSCPNEAEDMPNSKHESSDDENEQFAYANDQLWDSDSPPLSETRSSTQTSPVANSIWSYREQQQSMDIYSHYTGLLASLVREEGNVYSLAAIKDMLYTGSDSKNIRVWKNRKEFTGFKSTSGLVKSIVIANDKIFTGHRDGKIRVWNACDKNPTVYNKIGTLPSLSSIVEKAIKPKNYTEVRRNHRVIWIKHFDVISCLSLTEDCSLLYSGSWDNTVKVWNVSSFKCLESISAHDDAVNAVVAGFDDLVFSGSADGAIKVWRREVPGKRTRHSLVETLLRQESAVTSLVVNPLRTVLYAGLSDGLLHFWERDRLFCGGRFLRWHKMAVLCLATAGSMVFSGSADANICVWRRDDGGEHTCMYVLRGHSEPVRCLAVDMSRRDGIGERSCMLYSGSLDRSVKIWRVCTQIPQMIEQEPSASSKQKNRLHRSCNGRFQSFTDQGHSN